MTVATPTVGRFVQVNIGTEQEPAWRPAIVVAVWPLEYDGNAVCPAGLNVQVFLDGTNDRERVKRALCPNPHVVWTAELMEEVEVACRKGTLWATSLPHADAMPSAPNPSGVWHTGMRWRWPPRE